MLPTNYPVKIVEFCMEEHTLCLVKVKRSYECVSLTPFPVETIKWTYATSKYNRTANAPGINYKCVYIWYKCKVKMVLNRNTKHQ